MAEGSDNSWTPRDIANNSNNWSLASDASLLRYLESFSDKLLLQANETNDKLDNLLTKLDETSLQLDLARNHFSSLSNTQFIESRIYEDDETAENHTKTEENDIRSTNIEEMSNEVLKNAALKGLEVIDKYFDKYFVPHSDSEDETDFPSFVLRQKDLYLHRPLPYVIGSEEWYKSPNAGLQDSSSDSEEDKDSEKYSDDSESEIELPKPKEKKVPVDDSESSEDGFEDSLRRPVANSTFNDTRNPTDDSTMYNSVPVQGPLSQQIFAEQLAKKLGKVLENDEPDINRKPIQKPQSNYGKLFSEEPPPLEETDDDMFASPEKKHRLFDGGDGLFDDLEDDVSFWGGDAVSKKTESAQSERNKVVPNLFDDEPDDIFVKPKSNISNNNNFKAELDKKLKKPTNLFDVSSSSEEDLFANNTQEKTPTEKPSIFDRDDSSSDDMFTTKNKKGTPQDKTAGKLENPEEKLKKTEGKVKKSEEGTEKQDNRKPPIGGVKVMANPNVLQDKDFNKLLKARKQYSSDTSTESTEEMEDVKQNVIEKTPDVTKTEVEATNVAKSSTESKKISLFDDEDDDLFKDDLFSTKKPLNSYGEASKTKNLFDDASQSIFDDDIFIPPKEISQTNKETSKNKEEGFKNKEEEYSISKTAEHKPKTKKVLSFFDDEDADSDDIFSSNTKPWETLKKKEENSTNLGEKYEKKTKVSLFDDEDDDIFSSGAFSATKNTEKAEKKLFFDEVEQQSLFVDAKKPDLFVKEEEIMENKGDIIEENSSRETEGTEQVVTENQIEEKVSSEIKENKEENREQVQDEGKHNKETSILTDNSPEIQQENTNNIEETTQNKKVVTQRRIEENEYDFEPHDQITSQQSKSTDDIPPVKNIFEENSPPDDIFADITANITKNDDNSSKVADSRLLFDSSPPPEVDTWEQDNFDDDIYSFDNTEGVLGGQRSSIFDREPPSLFLNQSSGIATDQGTRMETDTVTSFYPYATSSRRFSADMFAEEYSDDSLFKKNSHTISNIQSVSLPSQKKPEEASSFFDITPSGKYSELYSEITEKDLKPRKSVTFEDDIKKLDSEDFGLKKDGILDENIAGDVGQKDIVGENRESLGKLSENLGDKKPAVPKRNLDEDVKKVPESSTAEGKEKSPPGKLKHNLNINVQALLPGMVPLRPNSARAPRPKTIAVVPENSYGNTEESLINSQVPFQLPRVDLTRGNLSPNIPNTQTNEQGNPQVLQSVTKTRARIPNRRPSTKRGREAFRRSCVDNVITHDEENQENPEENPPETQKSPENSPNRDFLSDLAKNLAIRRSSSLESPPPLPKQPPPLLQEPPQLQQEPPQLQQEPPQLQQEPSQLQQEPPQLQQEPPQLQQEPPQLQQEPPQLQQEPPQLQQEQPPPLPEQPPPPLEGEIAREIQDLALEKSPFVKTDDFASPEFFQSEVDDDLFSVKKLPPKSTFLSPSLFGDEDEDDFLQTVSAAAAATRKSETPKAELPNSSTSVRRPKSTTLKKLDNVEVTDDPLSAFDQ